MDVASKADRRAFDDDQDYNSPERRLMLATVLIAVTDALGNGSANSANERDKVRREALAWFRAGGPDFESVCFLAGLDPLAIRSAVLRHAASGQTFKVKRHSNRRLKPLERMAA